MEHDTKPFYTYTQDRDHTGESCENCGFPFDTYQSIYVQRDRPYCSLACMNLEL